MWGGKRGAGRLHWCGEGSVGLGGHIGVGREAWGWEVTLLGGHVVGVNTYVYCCCLLTGHFHLYP